MLHKRLGSVVTWMVVAIGVGLAASVTGCGYSLAGRGSFLPDYIERIGIPAFGNNTTVFEIDQVLTERVRQEFIGRGQYEISPDAAGVDALLTGQITSIVIAPAGFTDQRQASRYTVTLTMNVNFRDLRANRILWQNPSLVFREEYDVTTGTDALDPNAFFGQNANALERIAEDFSRTVVTAILEAF